MPLRLLAIVLAEALSVLALLLVSGAGPWTGPRLFGLTASHGVHVGDLPVVALWLVGMACCLALWRRGAP